MTIRPFTFTGREEDWRCNPRVGSGGRNGRRPDSGAKRRRLSMRGNALCNGRRPSNTSREARKGGMGKGNRRGISTPWAIKHVLFCTRRVWSNDTICLFCCATERERSENGLADGDRRLTPPFRGQCGTILSQDTLLLDQGWSCRNPSHPWRPRAHGVLNGLEAKSRIQPRHHLFDSSSGNSQLAHPPTRPSVPTPSSSRSASKEVVSTDAECRQWADGEIGHISRDSRLAKQAVYNRGASA